MFSGPKKGELVFSRLNPSRASQILHNPRYAGAYAYGVRQQIPRGLDARPLVKFVEQEQWKAFKKDLHAGYISWDEHAEILTRLTENAPDRDNNRRCTPREGPALLQGLAVCGRCGQKMTVRYHTRRGKLASPDYVCKVRNDNKHCHTVPGHSVDILIGEILSQRMSPATIDVALAVQNELLAKFEETNHIRYQHVENSRYEMETAKKRYMAIDPNNRLVADELESDWNNKIRSYRDTAEDYERRKAEDQTKITEEQRLRVLNLVNDFPKLWHSPTTEDKDRKRMIRLGFTAPTSTRLIILKSLDFIFYFSIWCSSQISSRRA